MEDIVVSGVQLDTDQGRITIFDLPDQAGQLLAVFQAVATGGIVVDMIVQNLTGRAGRSCRSACRRPTWTRALELTQDVARGDRPGGARSSADADIAMLFVLGVGMRTHTGVARRMFGALAARGINISMINTSEVCVSVVVDRARGDGGAAMPARGVRVELSGADRLLSGAFVEKTTGQSG